jgi:beta-lactamase class A
MNCLLRCQATKKLFSILKSLISGQTPLEYVNHLPANIKKINTFISMNKISIFTLLIFIFSSSNSYPQKTDKKLESQIRELLKDFHGEVGVYVHDLKKNKTVSINADSVFPTASMVKIPILIGIMDKIEKGELQYHQQLIYKDSLLYEGVDILGSFKNDEKIEMSKLMMLMLTMSDNTASLWLQSLAGTGTRINELMDTLGMKVTRVNSRTPGRQTNQTEYGWGQTTPYEMATLMEKIVKGEVINKEASAKMLRLLGRNYWDEVAISQIPSDVFIASKSGAVDESRNEVLFVNSKHCRYIFCICTNRNQDQSWDNNNEAWEMTRKLSKLLWGKHN